MVVMETALYILRAEVATKGSEMSIDVNTCLVLTPWSRLWESLRGGPLPGEAVSVPPLPSGVWSVLQSSLSKCCRSVLRSVLAGAGSSELLSVVA